MEDVVLWLEKNLLAVDKNTQISRTWEGILKDEQTGGEVVLLPSVRAAAKQESEACFEIHRINESYVLTYPFRQLHYHNWSGF